LEISTERVWKEFRGALKGFVLKRVQNEEDSEDILQDVFSKIHDNIGSLKDESRLRPWIYQITRNAIIDYYRSCKPTMEFTDTVQEIKDETPSDVTAVISTCVKPIIDGLPDKYREAIDLTDLKGLTQKELAERLGLSLSGAKSRVQRARGKLKEELLECCHFEFDRRGTVIDYQHKSRACDCGTEKTPCK
jgi:RNA polymerase sigma-70 factor (ECF subfamily)